MTANETNLGTWIDQERIRMFVGRESELAAFDELLEPDGCQRLLLVHGAPGIGKTQLALRCLHRAQRRGFRVSHLDAAAVPAGDGSVTRRIFHAFDLRGAEGAEDTASPEAVVVIDSFEHLLHLDRWLFQEVLPNAPRGIRVLIAGRRLPDRQLLADPGWHAASTVVTLRDFRLAETREYLRRCGLPAERLEEIQAVSHGHPLALSLIRDHLERDPTSELRLSGVPRLRRSLLEQLFDEVPSADHQRSLWVAAMMPEVTQQALRRVAALESARTEALWDWLAKLPSTLSSRQRIALHPLAQDALRAELRSRDPTLFATLSHRLLEVHLDRLAERDGPERLPVVADLEHMAGYFGVPRRRVFTGAHAETLRGAAASRDDRAPLRRLVREHEGERSAALFEHWWRRGADTTVYRAPGGRLGGFVTLVRLHEVTEAEAQIDPAVGPLLVRLRQDRALERNRPGLLCRFWMGADSYQQISSAQTAIFMHFIRACLAHEDLACLFGVHRDPEQWLPFGQLADVARFRSLDYTLDGHRYGLLGRLFGDERPETWVKRTGRRMVGVTPAIRATSAPSAESGPALDQPTFTREVKNALRWFNRPERLRKSPLLSAGLLSWGPRISGDGDGPTEALRKLVLEQAAQLEGSHRGPQLLAVLERTYFNPAVKQEVAAQELGLSYGTYRRYLAQAVARLTELLWSLETRLPSGLPRTQSSARPADDPSGD
jgi:hypothetical protein